jgi:short-subunit dehydrogenase
VNVVRSKVALITGASKGIGRAVALALAGEDLQVLITGRDENDLQQLKREIAKSGGNCSYITADLNDKKSVGKLTEKISTAGGNLSLLVHSAGIARVGPVSELSLEAWQESLSINLTAPFYLTRNCLPFMSRGSMILFINSVAGRSGFPEWSAYSAAKSGLAAFADALRQEIQPQGIKVVSIFPASVATPMQDKLPYDWDRSKMLSANQVAEIVRICYKQPEQVLLKNVDIENIAGTF